MTKTINMIRKIIISISNITIDYKFIYILELCALDSTPFHNLKNYINSISQLISYIDYILEK